MKIFKNKVESAVKRKYFDYTHALVRLKKYDKNNRITSKKKFIKQ